MPRPADHPLIAALRQPERLPELAPADWHPLLVRARQGGLLGTLAARAEAAGVLDALPSRARDALVSGRVEAGEHERMLTWETRRIRRALLDCGAPAILLKGAAYAALDLPVSHGRLTGDVDILVHRSDLDRVEAALQAHGWATELEDAYDQLYYRAYMHELPPLRHKGRGTVVDVHHTISPPTSRIRIDGESLWPGAPSGESVLPTLAPPDLVLHAVIHLFHEGNLAGGLRDLADIDGLLRHFGAEPGFWDALLARAEEFDARRVLAYGLRYAALLFDTPAPQDVRRQAARWEASPPAQRMMDGLVVATLLAAVGEGGHGARGAAWMLYVRSHWRRMPPLLLARHLLRKAVTRRGAD